MKSTSLVPSLWSSCRFEERAMPVVPLLCSTGSSDSLLACPLAAERDNGSRAASQLSSPTRV
eukprot:766099-Hanusia_phi.AAC.9